MSNKHTPAPWKIIHGWDENGNGKYFPSVILHGTLEQHEKSYGRNSICINVSHDQQKESLMANARLIAAAPELLEALIKLKNWVGKLSDWEGADPPCDLVDAAILKATKLD